jgi:penicillin-binding protein 1A
MQPNLCDFANLLILLEKMLNKKSIFCLFLWLILSGAGVTLVTLSGLYLYLTPKLPSVATLHEIKLATPLRVYSQDGKLIGEYGTERRTPLRFDQIPEDYVKALLAAEDAEFFEHHGVSIKGLLRGGSQILKSGQIHSGGSTLTMQLARDFYLHRRQEFTRKFNEILLSLEIERTYSKEEIFELFNNKMFFGNRAYGLQSAAQIYYGRNIDELTVAQHAMIVGILKAPSLYNPLVNPKRAMIRRNWILGRMLELGYLDQQRYQAAINEPNTAAYHGTTLDVNAPYISEMARQEVVARFGENAYAEGYRVYTTINTHLQQHAQKTVRQGLMEYDVRHGYRGPEKNLGASKDLDRSDWQESLQSIPVLGELEPAAVIGVSPKSVQILLPNGDLESLSWEQGLSNVRPYISENSRGGAYASATAFLKEGDVIRVLRDEDDQLRFSQVPAIQAALVSLDPNSGAIRSLVGGFDFNQSHYNRVTQGARQPGSAFKPLLYLVALENGFTPASVVNDAPIVLENTQTGVAWRPENDDGKFMGPILLRKALYRSRNMVSIRLLRAVGMQTALDSFERFGFNKRDFPRDLTLALGTHELTPLQMATAYSSIANGGFKVTPYLISRIEDGDGRIIFEANPPIACSDCDEKSLRLNEDGTELPATPNMRTTQAERIIDKRVAYLLDSMLKDVIARGTGSKAKVLNRADIAGKTGTTNGPRDLWFAGYNPKVTTAVWVGFDQNTLLGRTEYGSSAALPIWVNYMREALDGTLEEFRRQPDGIVTVRINPTTGKPAMPGDPDAIFEVFLSEDVTRTSSSSIDEKIEETLPDELF